MARLLKIILIILLMAGGSIFAQVSSFTAEQIIKKMILGLGSAKTYKNTGKVFLVKDINAFKGKQWEEVLVMRDFQKVNQVTFKSSFQRPDRVRFEWINNQSKVRRYSVVWADGKNVYSWRTDYEDDDDVFIWDRESSLKWAIEEETRGSMDVFDILYNGLTGSKEYYSFNKMTQARIVREETVSGHLCYVILGYINSDPWAVWIDKRNFVLRRYRLQIATGSFDESVRTGFMPTTLGEVEYESVQTNTVIPKNVFSFRPLILKHDIDFSKYKDEPLTAPPPPFRKPEKPDEQ